MRMQVPVRDTQKLHSYRSQIYIHLFGVSDRRSLISVSNVNSRQRRVRRLCNCLPLLLLPRPPHPPPSPPSLPPSPPTILSLFLSFVVRTSSNGGFTSSKSPLTRLENEKHEKATESNVARAPVIDRSIKIDKPFTVLKEKARGEVPRAREY